MRLKKALSLTLALVMSLAMAVPAFAAPITAYGGDGFPVYISDGSKAGKLTYKGADGFTYARDLYLVPVGATLSLDSGAETLATTFVYRFSQDASGNLQMGSSSDPGIPQFTNGSITFGAGLEGYWFISVGAVFFDGFIIKVGDGASTTPTEPEKPTEPTTPVEPEKPTEPTTPVEPVKPAEPTTPVEPVKPAEPTTPVEPVKPTEPTTPVEPEKPTEPTTPVEPVKPPVIAPNPGAAGTYTVKKGDTWSSICTNFYGTNAQRYTLMKANKGVSLKEGAVITLPEKLGKDTLIPAPTPAAGEKLYTVQAGDTLGKIAAAEYGQTSQYKAIFERNTDRLKNSNSIYEGQVIVLPAKG